jgi:nucleoside phosphorylase
MGPPLLIVCALRLERFALRGARPDATVIRTGVGARAAERAVAGALRDPAYRAAAVVATGFCAGLAPGMRPGDVVVADGPAGCGSLAAAVEAAGHAVHIGRLAQADHVVRGAERGAFRSAGTTAVDMESAAVLRAALAQGARAAVAARVVVDTPEHELLRPGTLRTGITAFRVLGDLVSALVDWHRSLMDDAPV